MSLNLGDHVSWKTSQGRTRGVVLERRTKPFQFAKQHFRASEDEPAFIVQSVSGAKAAHQESALRKLKD